MFFDPYYFLFIGPFLILALIAQWSVKHNFEKYARVRASSGLTGAEAAAAMLREAEVPGVQIEPSHGGHLSDHYDPRTNTIRLSPEVYSGRSLAALGVACHEAGHAIQKARSYAPLVLRNAAVPTANFGGSIGMLMLMFGIGLGLTKLAWLGVAFFAVVVLVQLVNLPVEFDASSRAKKMLLSMGMIQPGPEAAGVAAVLGAAAMTYVAHTAQSVMQLLYYVWLLTGRRRD